MLVEPILPTVVHSLAPTWWVQVIPHLGACHTHFLLTVLYCKWLAVDCKGLAVDGKGLLPRIALLQRSALVFSPAPLRSPRFSGKQHKELTPRIAAEAALCRMRRQPAASLLPAPLCLVHSGGLPNTGSRAPILVRLALYIALFLLFDALDGAFDILDRTLAHIGWGGCPCTGT